jgi:hypothetical protein
MISSQGIIVLEVGEYRNKLGLALEGGLAPLDDVLMGGAVM